MNRFFNCIIKKHGIRSGQFSCSLFSPASSVNFFSKRYKIPKSKKEKKQHNKEKEAFQSEKTEDTLKFDKFSRQIKPLPDDFKPDKPFSANMDVRMIKIKTVLESSSSSTRHNTNAKNGNACRINV
jgi:hypothetical protein